MRNLLLAILLLAALPAPGQSVVSAEVIVHAAPSTGGGAFPVTNWGQYCSIAKRGIVVDTNAWEDAWTNFSGTIDAMPYTNAGLRITLEFPEAVEAMATNWLAMETIVHILNAQGDPETLTNMSWMISGYRVMQVPLYISPYGSADGPLSFGWSSELEWQLTHRLAPPSTFPPKSGGGGNFGNAIGGAGFATYVTQTSTNLMATNWINVATNATGADGVLIYQWTMNTNAPVMFFRTQLQY